MPTSGYSNAYPRLVHSEHDIEGLIAYALYKQQKRALIVENELGPNHDLVKNYHQTLSKATLEGFRDRAIFMLQAYAEEIIESQEQSALEEVAQGLIVQSINNHIEALHNKLHGKLSLSRGIIIGVLSSLVASIVFGLLILMGASLSEQNPLNPILVEDTQRQNQRPEQQR